MIIGQRLETATLLEFEFFQKAGFFLQFVFNFFGYIKCSTCMYFLTLNIDII